MQLFEISCLGSFFFLLCVHGFQEGAFALVFKSIHYPGEAVATRLVKVHFIHNACFLLGKKKKKKPASLKDTKILMFKVLN